MVALQDSSQYLPSRLPFKILPSSCPQCHQRQLTLVCVRTCHLAYSYLATESPSQTQESAHRHSCKLQGPREILWALRPQPGLYNHSYVPYASLFQGLCRQHDKLLALEDVGQSQLACLGGCDPISIVTQECLCVFTNPQISNIAGSFGLTLKMSRQVKTSLRI